MPYQAKQIANSFINLANKDGVSIDPLKLQKLMYYANGYYLAEHDGTPLINEYFEAWDYGPVVPTVYYEFKEFGDRGIKRLAYTYDYKLGRVVTAPIVMGDPAAEDAISWVWENYKHLSGPQLSAMTHKDGAPWQLARRRASNHAMRNERLDLNEIKRYFDDLVN